MDLSFLKPNHSFDKNIRLVLTGGGSGGHTFPLIAVARELKKLAAEKNIFLELIYIGPDDFTLQYIKKEQGIVIKSITAGKLKRRINSDNSKVSIKEKLKILFDNIVHFIKVLSGIFQAFYYIYIFMPDAIFSKGGYGSFPVVFWGILFFIPVYTHESDAIPGVVNHIIGRFCKKIFISFEYTKRYFSSKSISKKVVLVGNPIRLDLFKDLNNDAVKEKIKKLYKLDTEVPVISVIGGSQGSCHINNIILDIIPKIIQKVELIHQTGKANYEDVKREAEVVFSQIIRDRTYEKHYHPLAFFEEADSSAIILLKDILCISDLIIARAGSGLIFEIAASGKPSILIPLPWASRGHQKKNAYEYAKSGAAVVVEEANLKPNIFSQLILQIVFDENKKKKMSEAAFQFAKPQAAQNIAKYLLELV